MGHGHRRHHRRHRRWHLPHHVRFYLAVVFTVVVVAYVAVPPTTWFVDSLAGYNPAFYEPKDAARGSWLQQRVAHGLPDVPWDFVLDAGLLLLVVIVWLTILPRTSSRRPSG